MSVSVRELRNILIDTIVQDYLEQGFSFNKSQFSFTKKIEKNKVSSMLLFYDYAPAKVEYHFYFEFSIAEIQSEIKKLNLFAGTTYQDKVTIILREGDFHPLVKNESLKFRGAFTHVITDFEKDKNVIDQSRQILKNEFFPRISIFSDLNSFQKYIIENYEKTIDFLLVLPALLALKLLEHEEFVKFVSFLKEKLQLDSKDDSHTEKIMVDNIIRFEATG
jgi:hypothetical protein